jgi:large subunit ribosomal protein L29
MKFVELNQLSVEDLSVKLASCKEELGKLNYQKRIGQVDKPHRFKELRRVIARIHTILRQTAKDKNSKTKDKI